VPEGRPFLVSDKARRTVGGLCLVAGTALLSYAGSVTARGWVWQERHAGLFNGSPQAPTRPGVTRDPEPTGRSTPRRGEALARLRVPRLGIDVAVAEGADPRTLSLGPGHIEGSALPGQPDNCIIAGHRDGPFRRLRSARPGDMVEIADTDGLKRYRIESVEVVGKGDTRVLAPSRAPVLTLVTCYPFNYLGHAPQRFIVHAALIDRRS